MSDTLTERMSRAYWCEWRQRWERITGEQQPEWDELSDNARAATECCFLAALRAIREPTPTMCDAGEGFNIRCGCPDCDHKVWDCIAAGWQAMIDAAIAEAGG